MGKWGQLGVVGSKILGRGATGQRLVGAYAAGRQHEESDALLLTGGLETGLKLAAAVHLDSPDGEGQPLLHGMEKLGGYGSRAPVCTDSASQRDTTYRAVKRLRITPGKERTSRVPICTVSPGAMAR